MRSAAAQPEKKDAPKQEEVEKVDAPAVEEEFDVQIEDDVPEPVVAKTEPKPAPKVEEKKVEDDRAALMKRLEEAQQAEELAKRRAAEFERRVNEQQTATAKIEQERDRLRFDSENSQLDAINAAMSAAKSESDAAELALEQAIQDANPKGQAEAHRRLAKAEGNLARLQDGKDELEYRLSLMKAERAREPERKVEKAPPEKEERPDVIEAMPIPDRAKEWLREHREFAEDQRKNAKLQVAHWDALDEGHKEFSTPYFAAVERLLGMGPKEEPRVEVEEDDEEVEVEPVRTPAPKPQQRSSIVSAPVSREGSTSISSTPSRSQVRLTKEEAEFAEQIGMSHAEFGKQKLKLQEMKRKGEIQ